MLVTPCAQSNGRQASDVKGGGGRERERKREERGKRPIRVKRRENVKKRKILLF